MLKKRQLLINSASLLANRIAQAAASFVVLALIARTLGAFSLGQYLLAATYYFVFVTIASSGFKSLFTRELARHPEETSLYLGNGTLLQLGFSLVGYLALVIVVFLLPYSHETSMVCYVMGLTLIPFSLSNVTEAIFQAKEKMHWIALSTVPIYGLRVLIMWGAMSLNYSVMVLALIFALSELLILLIEWALILPFAQPQWTIDRAFIGRTLKAVRSFIAIDGISAINVRMQVLILSILGGEIVVGLYGAIDQLLQPFQIVANSVVIAMFPSLSKASMKGVGHQSRLLEKTIEMLMMMALPLTIAMFFLGDDLLLLVYRDSKFVDAAPALNIAIWGLIMIALTRPLSYLLAANGCEKVNVREVIVTSILGGIGSLALVPSYQLVGAMLSATLMNFSACCQYIYAVYKRFFSLDLPEIFLRPLLISNGVLIVLLLLQQSNQSFFVNLIAVSSTYVVLVTAVVILPMLVRKRSSRSSRKHLKILKSKEGKEE